jgi:aspartate aminotransferase
MTNRVIALKESGHKVYGLSVGDPDFDTPLHIKEAAFSAISSGKTKYTDVSGTSELKQAIVNKFKRENRLTYFSDQILVSSGAKQSIYNLFLSVLNPGDEVIIPAPCWVSYTEMATLCDAKPIVVHTATSDNYKLSPEKLEQHITNKTKLLILNSPNNPTGICYSKKELRDLGDVLRRYPQILICSDDIYEHIYWASDSFCNLPMACPDLYERTIIVNGASKTYAMTGWRLGYAAGNKEIISAMSKAQSQSTYCVSSISQAAVVAALNGSQECVKNMKNIFKERHDQLVSDINLIPGFSCKPTQGAFYLFVNVEDALSITQCKDDVSFCEYLLEEAAVATVPGSAFFCPNHIRISFACSLDTLKSAITQIHELMINGRGFRKS